MKTSYRELRQLIIQELKRRNSIDVLKEEISLDDTVQATEEAIKIAEEESFNLYGEIDIERLASERRVQAVQATEYDRGMTAGEKYIDDLKQEILSKLV